jgi:hypothetical protein
MGVFQQTVQPPLFQSCESHLLVSEQRRSQLRLYRKKRLSSSVSMTQLFLPVLIRRRLSRKAPKNRKARAALDVG